MMLNKTKYIIVVLALLLAVPSFAQSDKQKELEAKRKQYLKEIEQLNNLLFSNKKKEKSVISQVEDLNYKVSVRKNLIKVTNDQANLLTREINDNQNKISELRVQLQQLKEDYAEMVVKSYKNKSKQSRVMFLLSSENFKQAYKRIQYFKQYREHQKKQGEIIKTKTEELQVLNKDLLRQKADKEQLIAENRLAKKKLEEEIKQQKELMASIKSNMKNYLAQIKTKQQEVNRIDKEIDRLIKAAIAASNKKAGKSSSSSTFALTPAGKALAANFEANKGRLPWPVEKGVVKVKFGLQPHPIDRNLTFNSKGIRIATEERAAVRAIFDGEVTAVLASKKGNPTILIQHGNYITAYSNIGKVTVKKGDKVSAKQIIGEVFSDGNNSESTLYFRIYKESKPQNPQYWLAK